MIPYGRQDISQADIDAVVNVLKSDWLTQGPVVPNFEQALANYCGANHAVAVNSATSALHIACLALDLGPGDRLWTSPNTFVASANCALYCGAEVDFVDIDSRTYNMSVEALEEKLKQAAATGKLPKVVVPVHFAGQSCDMRSIRTLADRYGFRILEDASHAVGGKYLGEPVGNCRFSDIAIFSFHPVKIVTTGEGGMALTNDAVLHERMQRLRSHGITRDSIAESDVSADVSNGAWYYRQVELGFNFRMTDIQAALGLSQVARLDVFVARRHELARRYGHILGELPVVIPWQHPDAHSSFHLYVICLRPGLARRSRREVFDALRAAGVGVNVHYIPVHTQPYYRRRGFAIGGYPVAEAYYENAISLPLFPRLDEGDQDRAAAALRDAIGF